MWKTDDFLTPTGPSADFRSAASAGASFSAGPRVGSDNYAGKGRYRKQRDHSVRSARRARPWSTMRSMGVLQRGETTIGPVAYGGRTITLVARTTAVHLGGDARGALHVRSRPVHVEVLDEHGRRHVVPIRNVERSLIAAIAIGGVASTYALRAFRESLTRKRRASR